MRIKTVLLVSAAIIGSALAVVPGHANAATAAPASVAGTAVVRQAPGALPAAKLSVQASKAVAGFQHKITVTAHLGTTVNRVVSIYERPFGSKTERLLKTGRVNSRGDLSATYSPARSTTWIAVFTGDSKHGPATAAAITLVHARVQFAISGWYTTGYVGNQFYYVFHHTATLVSNASVSPNKAGACVIFEGQEWTGKTWGNPFASGCDKLNLESRARDTGSLSGAANSQFRIRADFIRGKDTTNINTDSGWLYFVVFS